MDDEILVPISVPLDSDGFLRRKCPTCENEFKWCPSDESASPDQYFCPLCGEPAPVDEWWTEAQQEYGLRAVGPAIDETLKDALDGAFSGIKGMEFEMNEDFSFDIPDPEPLSEPDDMVIVVPPCHPKEPLKVPEDLRPPIHCLICGASFAA